MHMDRLVKLKSCESENIVALHLIYNQINIQVRGLEALNINHENVAVSWCLWLWLFSQIRFPYKSREIQQKTFGH